MTAQTSTGHAVTDGRLLPAPAAWDFSSPLTAARPRVGNLVSWVNMRVNADVLEARSAALTLTAAEANGALSMLYWASFLGPAHANVRLDQPVDWRARESLDEAVDHRLLENLGRALGLVRADFEHDLVVQPRDRTATTPASNSRSST